MIQSIQRAVHILDLFTLSKSQLGITEISRKLNLPKGTIQGLVQTMNQQGLLEKDEETRKYKIGTKFYELGVMWVASLEINHKAIDPAHQLAKEAEHSVRIGILDGDTALVTLEVSPLIAPYFSYQYGPRVPLYCTAIGKSLLAFLKKEEISAYLKRVKLIKYTENTMTKKKLLLDDLKRIKEKGYAINFAEGVMGRAGIAAPIFNRDGLPIAAISIVLSPSEIKDPEVENALSQKIIKTAFKISQKLT